MNKLNMFFIGAGALAVAGMAASGGQIQDKARADAVTTFNLTEADLTMMQACEAALSGGIEFKTGVSDIPGCGCIAHEMGGSIAASERAFAAAAFPTIVSAAVHGDNKGRSAQAFEDLVVKHNISPNRMAAVSNSMIAAVDKCADPNTYISDEQKAEIVKIEAAKKENSRVALNKLVETGAMTRAEADRRLARMN